jgi:hypothetical protein
MDDGMTVTGPEPAWLRLDATDDLDPTADSARRSDPADYPPIFVVELSGRALDFHRLLATLHRRNVGFTSLLFSGRRVVIWLKPDHRKTALLAAVVEREPVVISVEIRYIEPAAIDRVIDQLLCP